MKMDTLVYSALAADSGVAALVSTRIYPMILPETPTYPAITYQRISNTAQNGSTAIRESRGQINCWGATYTAAHGLATAVKPALEEHKKTDATPGIKQSYVINELDDYDDQADVYRTIIDVILVTTGD